MKAFSSFKELELPTVREDCQHAWHLFPLRFQYWNYFENNEPAGSSENGL